MPKRENFKLNTWFERDRQHVEVVDAATERRTIIEWWDEDVTQAVEDGFLDRRDFLGSALEYADSLGLIPEDLR
ncbi:hypothetical protein DVJ83_15925 (plasmid) [Deinococcus wulumuqiensis]|uniref:Uncharacterized protein n=1 Tax=Deinococcus wulumuqiensis TaxID=980427 RepID=A0A345ILS1_9DEIO|nr:hypothetical protein [Deinococcus wulumuqiensis]AXH00644.1 hypothetical protein DVJ83_15925 [Deinococcus wulumuqiensis]